MRAPAWVVATALVLASLALTCVHGGCDIVSPSAGVAGIKSAVDANNGIANYEICLESGTYTATSTADTDVDPSQITNKFILSGVGKTDTVIDMASWGRLFYTTSASDVEIHDMTITGASDAAVDLEDSVLTLVNVVLDGNVGDSDGGAVRLENSNGHAEDTEFTNNNGRRGGAVYVDGGSFSFERCLFHANTANPYYGGAVGADSATLTFSDSLFTENYDGDSAGGWGTLYLEGGLTTITGCLFYDNVRGIYSDAATIDITDCVFANEGGWTVYNNLGTLVVDSSVMCDTYIYCSAGAGEEAACLLDPSECGTPAGSRIDDIPYPHDFEACPLCSSSVGEYDSGNSDISTGALVGIMLGGSVLLVAVVVVVVVWIVARERRAEEAQLARDDWNARRSPVRNDDWNLSFPDNTPPATATSTAAATTTLPNYNNKAIDGANKAEKEANPMPPSLSNLFSSHTSSSSSSPPSTVSSSSSAISDRAATTTLPNYNNKAIGGANKAEKEANPMPPSLSSLFSSHTSSSSSSPPSTVSSSSSAISDRAATTTLPNYNKAIGGANKAEKEANPMPPSLSSLFSSHTSSSSSSSSTVSSSSSATSDSGASDQSDAPPSYAAVVSA